MLSMIEKSFLYGTFIWLLFEAVLPRWCATVGVASLLLLCAFAELYLPGRSAEITDPVLALLLGGAMFLLAGPRAETRSASSPRSPSSVPFS
jgi:peptidoglycan/LPS O-acetylase OafA/YrhL